MKQKLNPNTVPMMTLRTPRRRISPQTRQRYRAIKNFFKRAKRGSSSQPDIEINSSIAENVTDLKHKIIGLEKQLSEVSRTCREYIYLENSRAGSQSIVPNQLTLEPRDHLSGREPNANASLEIIYQTPESQYIKSEDSELTRKRGKINESKKNKMHDYVTDISDPKLKYLDAFQHQRRQKTHSIHENSVTAYSTSNIQSLTELREIRNYNPTYSATDKIDRRTCRTGRNVQCRRKDKCDDPLKRIELENYDHRAEEKAKHSKCRKTKHPTDKLDHDFIADIIKRQYKPVQLFNRRVSDLSQYSEPMCRDREFTIKDRTREDGELCSCCCGRGRHPSPKHDRNADNSDARSICDTRLYSSKKNPHYKKRRAYAEAGNDSELYDLIPVKEKSSPKTKRKIAQDNFMYYNAYREVPPSPRTHKPRLNLKAQYYTESDEYADFFQGSARRLSPRMQRKYQDPVTHALEQQNNTIHTRLNKTQETDDTSTEKTDRALSEIKDILQTFLQEIKKEAPTSVHTDFNTKIEENCTNIQKPSQTNANVPHSGHSFNNNNTPQCSSAPAPFMPPYQNPCCYPILPMYPVSCVQNPFIIPSPSFTCATCVNKPDDTSENKNKTREINAENETFASETDELIKEIYKLVAQSPALSRKHDNSETRNYNSIDNRILTSRSAGRSIRITRQDARVGTPKMQCYSKSCEAIGSRMTTDTYYGTDATYSETIPGSILENLSLEVTATTSSETELSTVRSEKVMAKNNKFAQVLRTFGLFKKKTRDTIEEQNESASTIDVEIKKRPPFHQDVTNYMMHDQEYYRPPPAPHDYWPPNYSHDYRPPFNHPIQNYHSTEAYRGPPQQHTQNQIPPQWLPGQYPPAPPNANSFGNHNQMQTQVPLCLKEIEVKSMATQSERKMSFFRKIKQKMQPAAEQMQDGAKTCATQTTQKQPTFWKTMQANANKQNDPMPFSFKTQMNLNQGDKTMRNAMIKKLFKKRNPFSPGNIIMKTLLNKDEPIKPPKMYRPSLFL